MGFFARIVAGTFATLALACGAGERPQPVAPAPKVRLATAAGDVEPTRAPARTAKLRYELRGRPFPLPLVAGRVAGHPVLMIVDTGASSHVMAGWLARRLGLPTRKLGEVGIDHIGRTFTTFEVDANVTIDGWGSVGDGRMLATEVPDALERLGIGLFIAPQRLVTSDKERRENDALVLDLAGGELREAPWAEATGAGAGGARMLEGESARVCEEHAPPFGGLAFVVPAAVEGRRVDLLVDTGAEHSDLFSGSGTGQALLGRSTARAQMYTASGKITARKLSGAKLTVGEVATTIDLPLVQGSADTACPRDGVLAMDVLRTCRLVFGRRKVEGRCANAR